MKKFFFLIIGMLLVLSCGHKEGIVQKSDKSFIQFTGNRTGVSVQIDAAEPFLLDGNTTSSDKKLYQLSPGKHTLKAYRSGKLIVNRILWLDNNVTKEVRIP